MNKATAAQPAGAAPKKSDVSPFRENSILIGTSLADRPVQRQFAALAHELTERGHRVALLVHGTEQDRGYVNPRVDVLRWPSPRPTRLADAHFFHRLLRQRLPCCLISNFGADNIMIAVGALRRVPIRIRWCHTMSSQKDLDSPAGARFRLWLLRLRARLVYRLVTHHVANSEAMKQDLISSFGVPERRCVVFANGLEDPLVSPAALCARVPPAPSKLICVGRLTWSKGQDILIRAVARLQSDLPELTLEFVGDGSARGDYEKLAHELGVASRCIFRGILPHSEVLEKMAAAWATIVPSRAEAFGLVNIESMAVGTPVLGSRTGGIAEIVRDCLDGFLFTPGDDRQLAARMLELARGPDLRAQMSVNCRRRFLERYELARAVSLQSEWLSRLIEGLNGSYRL